MEAIYRLQARLNEWWIPVLTGSALILISILMIIFPLASFAGLAVLFGWGIFVHGGLNLIFAIRSRQIFKGWIWFLMFGLIELAMGTYLLFNPGLAAAALLLYLGFLFAYTGISRISFSFVIKDMGIDNWWWTLIGGFLILLLAFLIITNPVFGLFSAVYLVSFSLFVTGVIAVLFGWGLKKLNSLM